MNPGEILAAGETNVPRMVRVQSITISKSCHRTCATTLLRVPVIPVQARIASLKGPAMTSTHIDIERKSPHAKRYELWMEEGGSGDRRTHEGSSVVARVGSLWMREKNHITAHQTTP